MGICAEISKLAKVKFPKKLGTISFIPVGLVVSVFEIFLKKARKLRLVFARLCWPGGKSLLVAEVILLRQQLLLIRRKQKRAPALNNWDRFVFAFTTFFIKSSRLPNLSSSVAHSTLVGLHKALVQRKVLTSISGLKRKPGPRGPSPELIELIVEIQQKNPKYGCPRIAMLVSQLLRIKINVSLVRRILRKHYYLIPGGQGPSWLTNIGVNKDQLWSIDFFRCESIVRKGSLTGESICQMFAHLISKNNIPKYQSSDNDPLFRYCPISS